MIVDAELPENNSDLDKAEDVTIVDLGEGENDPMIAEMRQAEAEIAGTAEPEGEKPKDEAAAVAKEENISIPKPRFDQVLSERDVLRDQIAYLQGVVTVQGEMLKGKGEAGNDQPQVQKDAETLSPLDKIEAKISEAETRKLELADKYEEGEISARDWKQAEIEIDKEIRTLSQSKFEALGDQNKNATVETFTALEQQRTFEAEALKIQNEHPNVAVIETYPEGIKAAIWNQIDQLAANSLVAKGVNINSNDVNTRLAVVREKAALTAQFTPDNIAAMLSGKPIQQNNQKPAEPSETAQQRLRKIELAESLAPSISDMGTAAISAELKASDLEKMSEDQMADLLQKAPELVNRALGRT